MILMSMLQSRRSCLRLPDMPSSSMLYGFLSCHEGESQSSCQGLALAAIESILTNDNDVNAV